ncbi:MAG: hypothetical protein RIT28_1292 [Pseudomonadota bacterium]
MSERSKDEVAEALIAYHFRIEPGMIEIYRLDDPDDAEAPIRLLEVNQETIGTDAEIISFGFAPSERVPFSTVVAEITPSELDQLRVRGFPQGWDLTAARVTRRSGA